MFLISQIRLRLLKPAIWMLASCVCLQIALPARAQAPNQDPNAAPEARLDEAIRKLEAGDIDGAKIEYVQALRGVRRDLPKLKLFEGLMMLKGNPPAVPEALLSLEEYNKSEDGRSDYRGYAAIGRVYKDSRRYLLATGPLMTAKSLAPRESPGGKNVKADITLDLAMAYHGMKKPKLALEQAKEAEQLAGGDPEIQLRLAEVALGGEDFDTSLRAADTAISLFHTRIKSAPLNKASYRSVLNALQFKINIGVRQAEANPQDPVPLIELAQAIQLAGDAQRSLSLVDARETALNAQRKVQSDARVTVKIKLVLAKIEVALGAFGEADEHVSAVLRDDPENQEALALRKQIRGGE